MKTFENKLTNKSIALLAELLNLAGWTQDDIDEAANTGTSSLDWSEVLKVSRGEAIIKIKHHVLDPKVRPDDHGWIIKEHRGGDLIDFHSQELGLYQSKLQRKGQEDYWSTLKGPLFKQRVANAAMLDYLRKYPKLIPGLWKKYEGIIFPGTTFLANGDEVITSLAWLKKRQEWYWDYCHISEKISKPFLPDCAFAIIKKKK